MRISLLGFSKFVGGSTATKLSSVQSEKNPTPYNPAVDFYKQLREFIPRNLKGDGSQQDLIQFASSVDPRKVPSYTSRANVYNDWWNGNDVRWSGGKRRSHTIGTVEVNVNPELFLSINGHKYIVKLYFPSERLTDERALILLRLMERAFRNGSSPGGSPAVSILDLSTGRYHEPHTALDYLDPVLAGEAASFAAMWESMQS